MVDAPIAGNLRATDSDRERALGLLNQAVAVGQLTLDEHDHRIQAVLQATYLNELTWLTADLVEDVHRTSKEDPHLRGLVIGLSVVLAIAIAFLVIVATNPRPKSSTPSITPNTTAVSTAIVSSAAAKAVPSSSTSAAVGGITIRTVPPGVFGNHDPADECGAFGTATVVGGTNCYIVVEFTNVSSSSVNVVPADVHMVDQTGDTYSIASVLPTCFEPFDVNAPALLKPNAHLLAQLCYPVMTGALPQSLKGTNSLSGLTLAVPSQSIVGTWGGA